MNYKHIKSRFINPCEVTVVTETGHEVKFILRPRTFIDMNKDAFPFFFVEFYGEYLGTSTKSKSHSYSEVEDLLKNRAIEDYWKEREYDSSHI